MKYLNIISYNEFNHSIKHFVLYRDIDFIVDTKPIMMPVINPANIFANNDDKNGLEFIHATDRLSVIIEIINIIVNPPRLIRFREYRRGFQTPHGRKPMPAALGRNGFLTTDTAQTQQLCHAASPSAGASGFALHVQSTA